MTVFVDGRSEVYGFGLLRDYRAILTDTPSARRIMEKHRVDLALLPKAPKKADVGIYQVVKRDPRWRLLFQDDSVLLYARRDVERKPRNPRARIPQSR